MNKTEIILSISFMLSMSASVMLVWYIRKVLLKLYMLQEIHSSALDRINEFKDHVSGIHELEMFYGDETLAGLIKHSSELGEYLDGLSKTVMFSYDDEEDEVEPEEDE